MTTIRSPSAQVLTLTPQAMLCFTCPGRWLSTVLAASVIRLGQRRHGPLTSREGASSRGPQRCNEAYG